MTARKALFLRNEGDEKFPNLKTEAVFEEENPPAHSQGSDCPGRVSESSHSGQRSAVETTDWHELEEKRFARQVAAAAERLLRGERATSLIVVAPPRTLAELSSTFHDDVRGRIVAELAKDLTSTPSATSKNICATRDERGSLAGHQSPSPVPLAGKAGAFDLGQASR